MLKILDNSTKCEVPFLSSDEDNLCDTTVYKEYSPFTEDLRYFAVSSCFFYLIILAVIIASFLYTNRHITFEKDKKKVDFFRFNLICLALQFVGLVALLLYSFNGFMLKLDPYSTRGKINCFCITLSFQELTTGNFYLIRIFKNLIGLIELSEKRNTLYSRVFRFLEYSNIIYLGVIIIVLIMTKNQIHLLLTIFCIAFLINFTSAFVILIQVLNSVLESLEEIVKNYEKSAHSSNNQCNKYKVLVKKLRIYKQGGIFQCFLIFSTVLVTLNPNLNTTPEGLVLQAALLSAIPVIQIPLLLLYAKYIYSGSDLCFSNKKKISQSNENGLNILSRIAQSIQLEISENHRKPRNSL
eukprot:snap_masked-scaffold_3-processed-gene-19.18-mRNA-1 protein AED:1.00 eAED:1.00 QI:0/-1/0/0/-1/1/1/0/353